MTAALTEGVINLEWTAVTGAVSYRLWAFDVEWELLVDEQDVTSHSHSGATAGTEYWYTVQAIDSIGLGGLFSEQVSATVPISGTATPTATVDGGRTEKCTLAAHHSDDKTFSTVGVPLLQSETLAAYRDKFGNDAKELDILRVDYYTDGRVKVWYSEANAATRPTALCPSSSRVAD